MGGEVRVSFTPASVVIKRIVHDRLVDAAVVFFVGLLVSSQAKRCYGNLVVRALLDVSARFTLRAVGGYLANANLIDVVLQHPTTVLDKSRFVERASRPASCLSGVVLARETKS